MVGGAAAALAMVEYSHATSCSSLPELAMHRNCSTKRKQFGTVKITSSFAVSGTVPSTAKITMRKKKQRKGHRRFVVVSELAGQYEDSFEDVKTQIVNYFTYKAVRTVMNQLYEMNPTHYRWFYDFVATNKPGSGKHFIRKLAKERQDLAERVMVTRLHLYGKWIKKCDHAEMYKDISDENLALMRERLMETVIWPSDDSNTEKIG
ncbi:Chaperonin-like RbcX protein 2, chloroplastic [Linum grandiflorum]